MPNVDSAAMVARPPLRGIQVLRGVAALMVVAFHAVEAWNQRVSGGNIAAWPNGAAGVDIFFVISGFVMAVATRSLSSVAGAWKTFIAQRLIRIVPMYWIFSTFKIATVLALPTMILGTKLNLDFVLRSFLFLPLHNWQGAFKPILPVGWTLTYEMLFYVLICGALTLHIRPYLIIPPALLALSLLPHAPGSVIGEYCNPIILEFGFGSVIAALWQNGWQLQNYTAMATICAAAMCLVLLPEDAFGGRLICWGLPAAGIVAACVALEHYLAPSMPRWSRALGDASYAIYLSHSFVLVGVAACLVRWHMHSLALTLCAAMATSAVFGCLAHVFLERPLLVLMRRRVENLR